MAEPKINGLFRVMNGNTNMRTLKEMNNLLDTLKNRKPSAITYTIEGRSTFTSTSGGEWNQYTMPLNKVLNQVGSSLVASGNGIKATKAMKCMISGQVTHWNPSQHSTEWDVMITRSNGSIINECFGYVDTILGCHPITPKLIYLAANEIIYLRVCPGCAGSFTIIGDNCATCLTVEEIVE